MHKTVKKITNHSRTAYAPVLVESDVLGSETRYFGNPWMELTRRWPQVNGVKLPFVLQIDLSSIPEIQGIPRRGLLSFFTNGQWDEAGANAVILLQDISEVGGVFSKFGGDSTLPAYLVKDWIPFEDHPHVEDLEEVVGLSEGEIGTLEEDDLVSVTSGEALTGKGMIPEQDAVRTGQNAPGHNFEIDKIGGWASWAQGNETPRDKNGDPMVMVFQINADAFPFREDIPDFQHPCTGLGHIWYSPATREWAHDWACS